MRHRKNRKLGLERMLIHRLAHSLTGNRRFLGAYHSFAFTSSSRSASVSTLLCLRTKKAPAVLLTLRTLPLLPGFILPGFDLSQQPYLTSLFIHETKSNNHLGLPHHPVTHPTPPPPSSPAFDGSAGQTLVSEEPDAWNCYYISTPVLCWFKILRIKKRSRQLSPPRHSPAQNMDETNRI